MKKIYFNLFFSLLFLSITAVVNAQTPTSAYVGSWTLDREKTSIKDLPQKFKDYRMSVSESETILAVKSQVDGGVEIEDSHNRSTNTSTVAAGSDNRTSKPGMSGVSATTSGADSTAKSSYGGTMALFFTPNQINYNLNGEEVKVEIKNGTARIRAKADKSGKLQFTTIRRVKTQTGEMEITTRETWKMSDDGKSLKLQRSVETPTSRDEITLFLLKAAQ